MSALTKLYITHGSLEAAQSVDNELAQTDGRDFCARVQNLFAGLAAGTRTARVDLLVEDITSGDRASATITCTQASAATGDSVTIGGQTFTIVASSPTAGSTFLAGASDSAMATNLAATINANAALLGVLTASASSGVVTITADEAGLVGEAIELSVAGSAAASQTVAVATNSAGDTLVVGGVTLTGSDTPSGEAQFATGGTDAATATSIAAKIAAHSVLGLHMSAAAVDDDVTITYSTNGTVGNLVTLVETGSSLTLGGATLAGGVDNAGMALSASALGGVTATQQVARTAYNLGRT